MKKFEVAVNTNNNTTLAALLSFLNEENQPCERTSLFIKDKTASILNKIFNETTINQQLTKLIHMGLVTQYYHDDSKTAFYKLTEKGVSLATKIQPLNLDFKKYIYALNRLEEEEDKATFTIQTIKNLSQWYQFTIHPTHKIFQKITEKKFEVQVTGLKRNADSVLEQAGKKLKMSPNNQPQLSRTIQPPEDPTDDTRPGMGL